MLEGSRNQKAEVLTYSPWFSLTSRAPVSDLLSAQHPHLYDKEVSSPQQPGSVVKLDDVSQMQVLNELQSII